MAKLRKLLEQYLGGAKKIALLAVGSELRGDDAAGLLIARKLQPFAKTAAYRKQFKLFIGETAPENLTGVIKSYAPDHLIIVDAADAGQKPGVIQSISPQEVGGISFSTHQLPLKLMIAYINESISCKVTIVGIQPKCLDFAAPVCKEVQASVKEVAQSIQGAVRSILAHHVKK